jgi:23S rRNA (uracil1939-C5)-methyltransferase
VSAEGQLVLKAAVVVEALQRTGKLAEPVIYVGGAVPPWAYRTTLRVAAGPAGRLGLRGRSSHEVIEMDGCPVSHPLLEEMLSAASVTGVGEVSLRVGTATGERSVWSIDDAVKMSGLPADVLVGPDAVVHEVVAGNRLQISASSFFQSGPAAAELLVAAVRQASGDVTGADLVDLYGGVGLFASAFGDARVTVVEGSDAACRDARVNLADHGAAVVCSAVERWKPSRAAVVIADPSRSGLGRGAVAVVAGTEAERLILVSCDPVSLARDAGLLNDVGYAHVASTVYDLFPNTHHVEVVTTFERRRPA